jgi:hypothetical protein
MGTHYRSSLADRRPGRLVLTQAAHDVPIDHYTTFGQYGPNRLGHSLIRRTHHRASGRRHGVTSY